MGKLSKDRRDVYYRKAKEEGYRARSAYKLMQLDDQFEIFKNLKCSKNGFRAVDLCAAPGSWSQVLQRRLSEAYTCAKEEGREVAPPLIVAVDLQEMAPIPGVIQLQGDITSKETADRILALFQGHRANVVVCDGAPDVTGMHDIDEYIQSQLLCAALRMAVLLLEPGATFIAKIFRGESASLLFSQLYVFFQQVFCCKPASSRVSSFEAFVVCRNFTYPAGAGGLHKLSSRFFSLDPLEGRDIGEANTTDGQPTEVEPDLPMSEDEWFHVTTVPFIACGDFQGFDSDTTFSLDADHVFRDPTQPPINPPYREAVEIKKTGTVRRT